MELQKLCKQKQKNLDKIETRIEKFGEVPDTVCLHNACSIKNNYKVVKFLLDNGCKLDHNSIINLLNVNISAGANTDDLKELICNYLNKINVRLIESCEKIEYLEKENRDLKKQIVQLRDKAEAISTSDEDEEDSYNSDDMDLDDDFNILKDSSIHSKNKKIKDMYLIDDDDEYGQDIYQIMNSINQRSR